MNANSTQQDINLQLSWHAQQLNNYEILRQNYNHCHTLNINMLKTKTIQVSFNLGVVFIVVDVLINHVNSQTLL